MDSQKIAWVFIVLLVIFVLGTIGMFLYQKNRYKDTYFEYNGFTIHKITSENNNKVYQTKVFIGENPQPYLITTRYNPNELNDIEVNNHNLKDSVLKKEIYITMESYSSAVSVLAATEISKVTGNFLIYNIPTHGALTSGIEGKNVTVKTCNDVSAEQSIMYLKQSNRSKIYSENGCVILEGRDEYDLIRVANKLIFILLGVMQK